MGCLFCNETSFTKFNFPAILLKGKEFKYVSCEACVLKYLHPIPDITEIVAMYEPSYHHDKIDKTITKKIYQRQSGIRFNYGIQFDLINKYAGNNATLLDYGCGDGNFMANAQNNGYMCDGVEYDHDYIKLLREGFSDSNIYHVNDFFSNKILTYDVVRMSNVLEHLIQPIGIINNLLPHLKPGGILLIEGPLEANISVSNLYRDLYLKIKRKFNPGFVFHAPPYHIIMSNAKNQRDFFKQFNPEIKEGIFVVDEFPWPFPESIKGARGFKQKLLAFFFVVAIFISKLLFRGKAGNGFLYIGQKS